MKTKKEIEKYWISIIQENSKLSNWKFKSYFLYKKADDFFFTVKFFINVTEKTISGWLSFKPFNCDNVFWDIINDSTYKSKPLSYRSEASFSIYSIRIFDFDIKISDQNNPIKEINELLSSINVVFNDVQIKVKTTNYYLTELLKDEQKNHTEIIVSYIESNNKQEALTKIQEYRSNNIESKFSFGNKDFFDLAEEYCTGRVVTEKKERDLDDESYFDGIYDKAKWHFRGDFPKELNDFQGYVHTGMYIAWLIEKDLLQSTELNTNEINKVKSREITGSIYYRDYMDGVLMSDDISEIGNKFSYFYYEKGDYLIDYGNTLGKLAPTFYHIEDTWGNYDKLKKVLDNKYIDWDKSIKNKKWWHFFK